MTGPQTARSAARTLRPSALTPQQQAVGDAVGAYKRLEAGLSLECVEDETAARTAAEPYLGEQIAPGEKRSGAA